MKVKAMDIFCQTRKKVLNHRGKWEIRVLK